MPGESTIVYVVLLSTVQGMFLILHTWFTLLLLLRQRCQFNILTIPVCTCVCIYYNLDSHFLRLAVTYRDLRGIPEFADKTILAIKAPPDTLLKCEVQEVRLCLYQIVYDRKIIHPCRDGNASKYAAYDVLV